MGRVLDGIRLSGMLRSEIALVLRKKQLHIFLCFHQVLHLVPCFAVVRVGCFLLGQQLCELRIQLLDLRQLLQSGFVKGSFRRLMQSDFLPVGFQKLFTVPRLAVQAPVQEHRVVHHRALLHQIVPAQPAVLAQRLPGLIQGQVRQKIRAVNDAEDVTAVVVPVGLHQFSGHIRQLLAKTFAVIRNSAQCSHCREKLSAVLQASARYSSVLFGI